MNADARPTKVYPNCIRTAEAPPRQCLRDPEL